MWPLKALRLLSIAGLALALFGPIPVLSSTLIDLTPRLDTFQSHEPQFPSPQQPRPIEAQAPASDHIIHLKSGDLTPGAPDVFALSQLARTDGSRVHVLLQLDFIPRDAAKAEYAQRGVKLLAYVPDYAWIASVPASDPVAALKLPGVAWIGPLTVAEKLDPAIVNGEWASFNLAPDGTAAVSVITHLDEDVAATRALVEKHGGKITGEVIGLKMFMVEMPQHNIRALAAEEPVQWIEPAEPPLGPANDGIRQQIGVNTVQAAPYSLTGAGIDVLVYDSGQVGNHTDFGARLIHGDAEAVEEHSTHVAGTVGGSGANSAALQWRGMAPSADLISYGTRYSGSGPIFYQNVPDIENDFAAAQNTHGADLGTASVGSNVYASYEMSCTLMMGKYGASSVLIDQIVRGGNSQVGVGDKYITTWAAGNERNQHDSGEDSCSDTYSSIAPPAAAKNPIHVGASNTNNNSMTTFSSWGPTQDGRIKPIVVAGGCQSGGDGGITSTDNNPVNGYTVMCGTSMATPAVAGSLALMLQHYRSVSGTSGNFWPSTAKAILMQTADDFGNPGPDYQWGFGQVDIVAAVQLISRTAFLQNNVAQGDIDVFYFPVMTNTAPAQVSLAWDDYQATFNANPALINNLDLELVAPGGTVWRPWVLNPASPANNATRGINTRDNQEQVTLPNPEIGTWLVRVKGATVPQGPQDYSLACEGCRALNAGVCQFKVSGAPQPLYQAPAPAPFVSEDGAIVLPEPPVVEGEATGEQWQRGLEEAAVDPSAAQADRETWALIEAAHLQGPAAVLGLRDQLTGHALELAQAEIQAAEARLNQSDVPLSAPAAPDAVSRVGLNGSCAYPTLQQAVNAATTGDTVRVSSGVYFENVAITSSKVITVEGGYDRTCTTPGAGVSHVNGSASSDNAWYISAGTIVLRNLEVSWGNSGFGAGVVVLGAARVTLDNVDVLNNHGTFGGGVYIATTATVTATNGSGIHDNTASSDGGGVKVWGRFSGYSNDSDIYNNCASNGGGLSVPGGDLYLNAADVYGNQAAASAGKGGGIYVYSNGAVTLTNNVFVYFGNTAYDGAGVYADNAVINLANATFRDNTATNNGGGLHLTNNSTLRATAASIGQDATGLYNEAVRGAGLYAITSTVNFGGRIINNLATSSGAGLYASNSTVNLTNATVGGTGADLPNLLGPGGHEGVGLFLTNNTRATLSSTVVASNTFQTTGWAYGGGMLVEAGSVVTLTNGRVERHVAPSIDGRGAGIYVRDAAVTLDNSQVLSNTTAVGGGVRTWSTSIVKVTNGSWFVNNVALNGEGGAIAADGTPDINISNATLQHNTAATNGGAIYLDAGTLDATGWWDFRWNNAGGNGGGVAAGGTGDVDFLAGGDRTSYLAVNHANGNGGALHVANTDTVQLYATSGQQLNLNTNTAGGNGGAVYSNAGAFFGVYGRIQASSNIAGGNGGVFYLSGGSRLQLDDYFNTRPQIWVNQAGNGGAIYAGNSPRVECDGADFGGSSNGNKALAGSGGAIYLSGSTFNADNCTFRHNQATVNGGAIAAYTSTLTIDATYAAALAAPEMDRLSPDAPQATGCDPLAGQCSAFYSNLADSNLDNTGNGGALYLSSSRIDVSDTYLHRNQAVRGGAIYQGGSGAVALVQNTLMYSNTSTTDVGAGIRTEAGVFTVTHVTLANNVNGAGYSQGGTTSFASNSIAWGNSANGFLGTFASAVCNIDQSGSAGPATNPQFVAAGAGENYRLLATSPARDACHTGLSSDLDNRARPIGARFDMGAYETIYTRAVYLPLVLK